MISSRIYWIAGANESALGLQSKYKAPRKKFDTPVSYTHLTLPTNSLV